MAIKPGDILGRYKVQQRLGRTGHAREYGAFDSELGRPVTIRVPSSAEAADVVMHEARVLASMDHPAVPRVFDIGRDADGTPYAVVELLSGQSLDQILRAKQTRAPEFFVEVLATVADVLDYLHRRGYLHRNVKPATILLDDARRVRLVDFIVARGPDDAVTKPGLTGPKGTPRYMAPEQVAMIGVGPHSDIWGLGVTLYECLTGTRPFEGKDLKTLFESIERAAPVPPSVVAPAVPAELERICLKCLSKDPAGRFRTAAELAADLRAWLPRERSRLARRVFVSHSSADRPFVESEIIRFLEAQQIPTWYSREDIQTSQSWEESIKHGLASCGWFLVVMSSRSCTSEWVKDEVHWAVEERPHRIIPILIEDCNRRAFHIRLARIQHIDFRSSADEGRRRLLELLRSED